MAHSHSDNDWRNSLCSHVCGGDCSTCWGAWCCGSCLFGRVSQRIKLYPSSDRSQIDLCDGNCALFCVLGAAFYTHWIPLMMKRQAMRDQHGIRGDACQDCCVVFWCTPCSLAQMETEMKDRATSAQKANGNGAYRSPQGGMVYAQPAQMQQQGVLHPAFVHQ